MLLAPTLVVTPQHAVLTGNTGWRYSSTHRVAVTEGHTYAWIKASCKSVLAGGEGEVGESSLLWSNEQCKSEQQALNEVEFEWLRQVGPWDTPVHTTRAYFVITGAMQEPHTRLHLNSAERSMFEPNLTVAPTIMAVSLFGSLHTPLPSSFTCKAVHTMNYILGGTDQCAVCKISGPVWRLAPCNAASNCRNLPCQPPRLPHPLARSSITLSQQASCLWGR